ncbi:acyl-CoA thioesterase II [Anaeromyxobacter soli]|uniref:acyl-CoA thioesterase II n=1 Tax=Anaeromyxobacter soli TaxID=2922725 RepID=UPI001FAE86BD|nr:acyl-CoA thioesterase II [Anaeromyxobacter sp. SG29]
MDPSLSALIRQLDLEQLEVNLFRGESRHLGSPRVFGGQVISQALVAAERTVDGRPPHSLHAYFLLPGDVTAPIVYQVDRIRDGRSFSARRVQAIQHGRPILSMIASFQKPEPGLEHATSMPEVPPPEALASHSELVERWLADAGPVPPQTAEAMRTPGAIEFRPVEPQNPLRRVHGEPRQAAWFRAVDRLPDDPHLHRCILAYASDSTLAGAPLRPHGRSWWQPSMIVASLDHALWFHRQARVDEWLLYTMDSPSAQSARGLARGLVFDRSGLLVASVAQEILMRDTGPARSA